MTHVKDILGPGGRTCGCFGGKCGRWVSLARIGRNLAENALANVGDGNQLIAIFDNRRVHPPVFNNCSDISKIIELAAVRQQRDPAVPKEQALRYAAELRELAKSHPSAAMRARLLELAAEFERLANGSERPPDVPLRRSSPDGEEPC